MIMVDPHAFTREPDIKSDNISGFGPSSRFYALADTNDCHALTGALFATESEIHIDGDTDFDCNSAEGETRPEKG